MVFKIKVVRSKAGFKRIIDCEITFIPGMITLIIMLKLFIFYSNIITIILKEILINGFRRKQTTIMITNPRDNQMTCIYTIFCISNI